jgi:hypothetical protein
MILEPQAAKVAFVELQELIDGYCAAWNESDGEVRRALLADVWSGDGVYCDPTGRIEGRDAVAKHIDGFQERMVGHRIDATSWVDDHHGWFRFSWRIVGPDGGEALEGFDVGERDDDGRISRIVGFFGPFRQRTD